MNRPNTLRLLAAAAAAFLVVSCSSGTESSSSTVPNVRTSISLAQTAAITPASVERAVTAVTGGRIPASSVDSLIVVVSRVDVLPDSLLASCRPPVGDSIRGFRPGDVGGSLGTAGPNIPATCQRWRDGGRTMGPDSGRTGSLPDSILPFPRPDDPRTHDDSLLPPATGWGSRADEWYSLAVVGSGHLDLFHLPTDSANGLVLASDSVPAGDYGAARLIITGATLWLNTAVTTEDSVTLKADTGYTVKLPSRMGGEMGIMTDAGFTVPSGGGNVVLIFDVSQMLATPVVTRGGAVILGPMLRPRAKR